MDKLKDVSEIKHRLVDWVKTESVKGFNNAEEVEIMGEVVDMIKDLASAEKDCMEACYYETVTEAMSGGEESERMGFDRWRYASGRFAPKGRGTRMGYDNGRMMPEPRNDDMINGRYGYTEPNMRMGHAADLDATIESVRTMWDEAKPEDRKRMREILGDLVYQMEQQS